jgi:hypothetical protein
LASEEESTTRQLQQQQQSTMIANDSELPDDTDEVLLPGLGDVMPTVCSPTTVSNASTATATAEAMVKIQFTASLASFEYGSNRINPVVIETACQFAK